MRACTRHTRISFCPPAPLPWPYLCLAGYADVLFSSFGTRGCLLTALSASQHFPNLCCNMGHLGLTPVQTAVDYVSVYLRQTHVVILVLIMLIGPFGTRACLLTLLVCCPPHADLRRVARSWSPARATSRLLGSTCFAGRVLKCLGLQSRAARTASPTATTTSAALSSPSTTCRSSPISAQASTTKVRGCVCA